MNGYEGTNPTVDALSVQCMSSSCRKWEQQHACAIPWQEPDKVQSTEHHAVEEPQYK